jgi:hypothetical protein
MSTRSFATIFGGLFLAVGVAGFVPPLVSAPSEVAAALAPEAAHGRLFGLFPVNAVHNLVHIGFGVWGLLAARSLTGAILYARVVAIAYLALALMGFVPGLDTLFGLAPLYGNAIWLHAILAAIGAYFGWVHRNPVRPA